MRSANRAVVTDFHLRLMRAVGDAHRAYGDVGLRLEGGTALAAYYLGHRQSADLDFFGDPALNARDFGEFLRGRIEPAGVVLEPVGLASQGFARYHASEPADPQTPAVLLDFARNSPFQLASPEEVEEGIRVGSYRDLCAGKLHAVCGRFEPRDFLDLSTILAHQLQDSPADGEQRRRRFLNLLHDAKAADPGLTVPFIAQSIARGIGRPLVSLFPLRLFAELREEDVQATLRLCVEECAALVRAEWEVSGKGPGDAACETEPLPQAEAERPVSSRAALDGGTPAR